jgi:hypothetical protein
VAQKKEREILRCAQDDDARRIVKEGTGVCALYIPVPQILAGVDGFVPAGWALHFLAVWWQLRGSGDQIIDEFSVPADLGVSEAHQAIAAVNHPSWIEVSTHDGTMA